MSEELIETLVAEVLQRLLPRLGANGERGTVIAVFTGATCAFSEAVRQVQSLVIQGFRVRLAFSEMAEHLYGELVRKQLAGFPFVDPIAPRWLRPLTESRAVIVPLLSVNTLSKLSLLIADSVTSNLILHGLFLGKPVILAHNGVDPSDPGRRELGFDRGQSALTEAIRERMRTVAGYGCVLADVGELTAALEVALAEKETGRPNNLAIPGRLLPALPNKGKILTSADVVQAHQLGVELMLAQNAVVTPLARDLAARYGIRLSRNGF